MLLESRRRLTHYHAMREASESRWTVPNALSAVRLAVAPVLLGLAWMGQKPSFLILLAVSLLTDAVDGMLARRHRQESSFGARLDSWGDLANYVSLPLCVWWLWPDVIRREAPFVIAAVASYVLPAVVGMVRFRRLTCYHAWSAKASAVLIAFAVPVLLLGFSPWPFRLSTPVLVLSAVDDIAITMILKRWQPDVPSLLHAIRIRRVSQVSQ